MEAWYMKEGGENEDQRLPHHCEPKQYVSLEKLADLGVLYWHLEGDNYETNEELEQIRKDRGYTYSDTITCSPDKLPNYEVKLKSFFEEHIHTDEEIRLVLDGSGYFDVRDQDDRWIRVWVKKGDLIVLPAGIYHRFTMDSSNYTKAMRLFVGEPVWTPYNRPQDDNPIRKGYIDNFISKDSQSSAVEAS
ncbi:hypothetical protein KI387_041190 [Taxus chinensis]|uniref:Acireductone dioxygenase n=1 Tax=Taxus chinensis TaxID=29808 RepID=A0AA38F5Y5_TAXCH|nr:hypothetical protein KI387_041190 [Taxus chinensis]